MSLEFWLSVFSSLLKVGVVSSSICSFLPNKKFRTQAIIIPKPLIFSTVLCRHFFSIFLAILVFLNQFCVLSFFETSLSSFSSFL